LATVVGQRVVVASTYGEAVVRGAETPGRGLTVLHVVSLSAALGLSSGGQNANANLRASESAGRCRLRVDTGSGHSGQRLPTEEQLRKARELEATGVPNVGQLIDV